MDSHHTFGVHGMGPLDNTPKPFLSHARDFLQPMELITPASPPPSQIIHSSSPNSRPSPGHTIRELAHKLSQQNLQPDDSPEQPQPQPPLDRPGERSAPPSAISLDLANLPDLPTLQPWPVLEVDDEPDSLGDMCTQRQPDPTLLAVARRRSQLLRGESPPIDAERRGATRTEGTRLRKQLSGQFRDRSSTLANKNRVEEMISAGSQCNVQDTRPSLALTPSLSSSATVLEPDPNLAGSAMVLEVDDAYCNGSNDVLEEDMSFVEAAVSLRRAGAPGGIRKQIVAGVPLRYQLSADAALRCQTVVRSRPRMRKRNKTRPESVTSSGVTSAMSSPVIPPSIPSPHLHPYR